MLKLLLAIVLIWLIGSFHWLRISALALVLVVWFALVLIAPLVLVVRALDAGNVIGAVATAVVCVIPGALWVFAFQAAQSWIQKEIRFGRFWRPWNAR